MKAETEKWFRDEFARCNSEYERLRELYWEQLEVTCAADRAWTALEDCNSPLAPKQRAVMDLESEKLSAIRREQDAPFNRALTIRKIIRAKVAGKSIGEAIASYLWGIDPAEYSQAIDDLSSDDPARLDLGLKRIEEFFRTAETANA